MSFWHKVGKAFGRHLHNHKVPMTPEEQRYINILKSLGITMSIGELFSLVFSDKGSPKNLSASKLKALYNEALSVAQKAIDQAKAAGGDSKTLAKAEAALDKIKAAIKSGSTDIAHIWKEVEVALEAFNVSGMEEEHRDDINKSKSDEDKAKAAAEEAAKKAYDVNNDPNSTPEEKQKADEASRKASAAYEATKRAYSAAVKDVNRAKSDLTKADQKANGGDSSTTSETNSSPTQNVSSSNNGEEFFGFNQNLMFELSSNKHYA